MANLTDEGRDDYVEQFEQDHSLQGSESGSWERLSAALSRIVVGPKEPENGKNQRKANLFRKSGGRG